jgi:hypothetical protein
VITIQEAKDMVEHIRATAEDDEHAHAKEDELRKRVLEAVLAGSQHAQELAAIALSTAGIDFSRWCA